MLIVKRLANLINLGVPFKVLLNMYTLEFQAISLNNKSNQYQM